MFCTTLLPLFAAVIWMPHVIPDLKDWVRKLAATSSYDKCKWRDLSKGKWEAKHHSKIPVPSSLSETLPFSYLVFIYAGIGDFSEIRPALPGEGIESSIPKLKKDNKRKRASKPEDPQTKTGPAQRRRRNVILVDINSVHQLLDEVEDEGEDLALVARTKKPVETTKPSKLEILPRGKETSKKDEGKSPESPEVMIVS